MDHLPPNSFLRDQLCKGYGNILLLRLFTQTSGESSGPKGSIPCLSLSPGASTGNHESTELQIICAELTSNRPLVQPDVNPIMSVTHGGPEGDPKAPIPPMGTKLGMCYGPETLLGTGLRADRLQRRVNQKVVLPC